jgi:hypothetical protein
VHGAVCIGLFNLGGDDMTDEHGVDDHEYDYITILEKSRWSLDNKLKSL